jgi:hypothetical protein
MCIFDIFLINMHKLFFLYSITFIISQWKYSVNGVGRDMPPEDFETELKIGARNPFAYAEHKSEETINWHHMDPRSKRDKLIKEFKIEYEYDQLFNPENEESPLFVGDMRPCNPVVPSSWGTNPGGNNYTVGTRAYNDPVQGILPDCYLISALSSLAFLNMIPAKQPVNSSYSFTFYNPPVPGGTPTAAAPVNVTYNLPLDASGKYSYSKSFTTGEIWIAMYEKAFASWKGNNTDKPDYQAICQGDPVYALLNLTGWKFDVTSRFSTLGLSGAQIYDKINSVCKTSGIYRTTAKPMVAYTYDPRIENPTGVTYRDATIVGNHSYSVLGVHTIGAEKYIVMRNPWGQKGAGPGSGDPDPTNLPAGALASGPWYQNANLLDPNDACFALKASVFKDYFKGFGWVYP